MTKGFFDFTTDNNDYNVWQFLIQGALSKIRTAFLAKVVNVYKDRKLLDVIPLIKGVDGDGNELEQAPLFRLPYFQYRGGVNQITVTPAVNDCGLAIASDRDITDFKLFRKETKPATLRMFDARDSLYVGGFLNNSEIKNFIEINDDGIRVKTDKEIEEMAGEDITLISQKDGKQSSVVISHDQIKLETNGQSLILNENGLIIEAGNIDLRTKDLTLNVDGNLKVNVKGATSVDLLGSASVKTNTGLTVQAPKISFAGLVPMGLVFSIDGFQLLTGNLTTVGIAIPAPLLRKNKETFADAETATHGVLTTNVLSEWDDFIELYEIYEKTEIKFKIEISDRELEISVPVEEAVSAGSYEALISLFEEQLEDLATVEVISGVTDSEKKIKFTTVGTGDVGGYISYLQDITENINATAGTLTTGTFGDWNSFLSSLNSQNLAFRLTSSGKNFTYHITYSDIAKFSSFTKFADYLTNFNEKVIVTIQTPSETENVLVFETADKGAARGRISYLKETDTPDTPAVFLSGSLPSWDDFIEAIDNQDFAVQNSINGTNVVFYMKYEELVTFTNYGDFVKSVFKNNQITTSYTAAGKINITTKSTGETATLTFFEPVEEIPATKTFLETGVLPDFRTIKEAYSSGKTNITFFIVADGVRTDYVITPELLSGFGSYDDMVNWLTSNSTNIVVTLSSAKQMIFTLKETGRKSISYLQYQEPTEEEPETIDGSVLFAGTESFATITDGTDEITDINQDSATILKMTEETGATISNGSTLSFADNSIRLMKGTEDTGAKLVQGRDGVVVVLNDSATLLKGTQETGAIRMSGSDDGIPDVYDGLIKFIGKLSVTEQIESDALIIDKKTDLTGEITMNPFEIEEEVYKKSDVTVNGGIITENLMVTETGTIDNLVVNNGVEINGDINLNFSSIKSNGNVMTFESDGIRNNKMFISSDYKAD